MKKTKTLHVILGIGMLLLPFTALSITITKEELMSAGIKVADRIALQKTIGRNWEDALLLSSFTTLTEKMEKEAPGSGQRFLELVAASVGDGYKPIGHGDYTGYATSALDLYQLAGDVRLQEKLLRATDGPFAFAEHAINGTPANSPPFDGWWVEGGYGTRYWVDDLYTLPVWLSQLSSTKNRLPGNKEAGYLAEKLIQEYVGLLWDPNANLFWHDQSQFDSLNYWGRGNGWAAYGLTRTADFLERKDRDDIHVLLSKMAVELMALQAEDGGWPSNLGNPFACGRKGETSATGLNTFMLVRGVSEGWLDRKTYLPVIRKALRFLLGKVDVNGDVSGIQPPGTGPDCAVVFSNDVTVNVNYGPGAVIFALVEASELGDENLAPKKHPRKENPRDILSF